MSERIEVLRMLLECYFKMAVSDEKLFIAEHIKKVVDSICEEVSNEE